ncbi:AraC family transcriptional regulator [Cupriavidus basilensis]|uniref:AraC family transcriptional regulator n=1 Tax=Cupriavidus basilensis TaxID=68895 RepID=A0ABT6AGL1_9BURK|nr:AraC family transcriptional regulator [Cupriavidus basilensis]MDF3831737.1 AraC family transcriptional regulator [Cupriavidus basilensis]
MSQISGTVPISLVNGFLSGADPAAIERLAECSGIRHGLLRRAGSRVTEEQFSTLYRLLATELDDEMPGIFSRPLRNGTLKYLCLSLLDAPRLEVALHRFGQFFHLILDDFRLESGRDAAGGWVAMVADPAGPGVTELGRELMMKLVHGIASWLVAKRIPLIAAEFDFARPEHAADYLYLFPGPVQFGSERTRMRFEAAYLEMPVRQRKSNLQRFLARAPEDWIFVSFAEQMVCHRVRQYLADCLPAMPTLEVVAQDLHYSVRTLCRRLAEEGTTFQAIKDDVRRDIAIQRLTRSPDAIAAIAYDVGFDNPTAFHRAFRHWTGSTPKAYRGMA